MTTSNGVPRHEQYSQNQKVAGEGEPCCFQDCNDEESALMLSRVKKGLQVYAKCLGEHRV
jgi:hypothetical protein